jgi:hypothetical protein
MYWIAAVFILIEILFFYNLDKIIQYSNILYLVKKYKDEDLIKYLKEKFKDFNNIITFFGIFMFLEYVYFIIALFYPFWFFSVLFFIYTIGNHFKNKKVDISKVIKRAKLEDFKSSDVKFERMLKMNELENIKINEWTKYIIVILKIIMFISIIVLHYNYKLI